MSEDIVGLNNLYVEHIEKLKAENQQLREELDKEKAKLKFATEVEKDLLAEQGKIITKLQEQLTSYKQSLGELLNYSKQSHWGMFTNDPECIVCQAITRAEQLLKEG